MSFAKTRPLYGLKGRDRHIRDTRGRKGKRHGSYWKKHRSHPVIPIWLLEPPKQRPSLTEWFPSVAEAFRHG